MRKELLDNAGGIQAFGCYLAEDFFFAKAILVRNCGIVVSFSVCILWFQDQNYKLAISTQPAAQNSGNASVSNFQNRISRYLLNKTMRHQLLVLKNICFLIFFSNFDKQPTLFQMDKAAICYGSTYRIVRAYLWMYALRCSSSLLLIYTLQNRPHLFLSSPCVSMVHIWLDTHTYSPGILYHIFTL